MNTQYNLKTNTCTSDVEICYLWLGLHEHSPHFLQFLCFTIYFFLQTWVFFFNVHSLLLLMIKSNINMQTFNWRLGEIIYSMCYWIAINKFWWDLHTSYKIKRLFLNQSWKQDLPLSHVGLSGVPPLWFFVLPVRVHSPPEGAPVPLPSPAGFLPQQWSSSLTQTA